MASSAAEAAPDRSVIARVAGASLLTIAGVGVAATMGGFAGRAWWVFDLLANFRPLGAVLLLLAAAGLAGLRRWTGAAVVTTAALLNVVLIAPYLLGAPASPPDDAELFEVVSFNVGISTSRRSDVMTWIASEDPDLVFLFESSFEWEDAAMAADLGLAFVAVVPRNRLAGVTVLARPDLAARIVDTPFDPSEAAAVEIVHDGDQVTVLGLHPLSPTDGGRAERRDALLGAAGDWVAVRSTPVLVVGDLNATPWSTGFRALERRGSLVDSLRGRGFQPSWPEGFGPLMIPIDHALHTEDLAIAERRTGPANGSAHRPLVVAAGRAG